MNEDVFQFLANSPVFASLPREEVQKAAEKATAENYPRGHVYAIQGQTQIDGIYAIEKGLFFERSGYMVLFILCLFAFLITNVQMYH